MDTIQKKIKEWSSPPFDQETVSEIQDLVAANDEKELYDRFYRNLEFGTGGLRGLIGAGSNRMNLYTVAMATQGLANYIIKQGLQQRGVVVARDSRNKSGEFARETASIMGGNDIPVYYFNDIMPTPLASFAVRHFNAGAAVVITASHNPPEYNGYKVYWDDGGQIVPPHDTSIIGEVESIQSMEAVKKIEFSELQDHGAITFIDDEVLDVYLSQLEKSMAGTEHPDNIAITYTPLHGTGYRVVPWALKRLGFSGVRTVESQSRPDGNFPTVETPNPEERSAMGPAIAEAEKSGADLVMATDPDSDRMGIGCRDRNGGYVLLNGNQIGSLLEYYILKRLEEQGTLPENGIVVKTVVTSELQSEIAGSFNCRTDNVLTGFKWIAARMKRYEADLSGTFVFGGEESFGYLPVDFVRDKDAVSSCCYFAEMVSWLADRGSSLLDFLDEIYCKYNLYLEDLHSLTLKGAEGKEAIAGMMKSLRENTPSMLNGSRVTGCYDMMNQTVADFHKGSVEPAQDLPKSNVLQLYLDDGSIITARPSGTEPKIKLYFSVKTSVEAVTLEGEKKVLAQKLEALKHEVLDLVRPKT